MFLSSSFVFYEVTTEGGFAEPKVASKRRQLISIIAYRSPMGHSTIPFRPVVISWPILSICNPPLLQKSYLLKNLSGRIPTSQIEPCHKSEDVLLSVDFY